MFDNNTAILIGEIQEDGFVFSHRTSNKAFYKATIAVERNSGTFDYIPVIAEESMAKGIGKATGKVKVGGMFSSYDTKLPETTPRVLLYLMAKSIMPIKDEKNEQLNNYVCLTGYLYCDPNCRRTPLGRWVTDLRIVVRKRGKCKHILPCIAWEGLAKSAYTDLKAGDEVKVEGRLQSREYFKRDTQNSEGGEYKTAYEVSLVKIEKIT